MVNMGLVALLLCCLFFFMLLGFPLFMSMIFSPLLCMAIYAPQVAKVTVVQEMRNGIGTFVLLAVPMFILAADIMGHGEMADRLLGFVGSFVRHLPGGLALTTGATCTIFGAISGSTQATLVAIGRPMYKPLLKSGYSTSHTIALVMCNANIALLIPPSVAMIMYCVCTGVSVGDLFLCGFGPGIILFLGFAVYDVIFAKRHGLASSHKATWKERGTSFRRAILALGFPVIVLGGIYSGMFTPTEAATVAVFCIATVIDGPNACVGIGHAIAFDGIDKTVPLAKGKVQTAAHGWSAQQVAEDIEMKLAGVCRGEGLGSNHDVSLMCFTMAGDVRNVTCDVGNRIV